ncbi:MAG: hypothetical protein ABIN91_19205 [Mucilaginibacter sp.]|uniref:DUF6934 family protein n=1 Tax=Mucilaginibacter sp. TaxID=1882438 RepID=UPI003263581F
MNLERYQYLNSNDYHDYEFWSEGPKGRISKMVTFSRIPNTDPAIYNLAFGVHQMRGINNPKQYAKS